MWAGIVSGRNIGMKKNSIKMMKTQKNIIVSIIKIVLSRESVVTQ